MLQWRPQGDGVCVYVCVRGSHCSVWHKAMSGSQALHGGSLTSLQSSSRSEGLPVCPELRDLSSGPNTAHLYLGPGQRPLSRLVCCLLPSRTAAADIWEDCIEVHAKQLFLKMLRIAPSPIWGFQEALYRPRLQGLGPQKSPLKIWFDDMPWHLPRCIVRLVCRRFFIVKLPSWYCRLFNGFYVNSHRKLSVNSYGKEEYIIKSGLFGSFGGLQ